MLEGGVGRLPPGISYQKIAAWGWLGAVAARQGDVDRAADMDERLAAVDDAHLRGDALFYRAGIAAWSGDLGQANQRFREACAAGWRRYATLHDRERILLEPVVEAPPLSHILHPSS